MIENKYRAIGLMSGTSLDGLDIAYCSFKYDNKKWNFKIEKSSTIKYPIEFEKRLSNSMQVSSEEINQLDIDLGSFWGTQVSDFIKNHAVEVDFICSHGHTIFHQPEKGITLQIGSAYEITKKCNVTVISDFRTLDVKLGGQGAPLVPIGDKYLFPSFDYCLNLGGISNVSFDDEKIRKAYDISPCNLILNHYANKFDLEYDNCGKIGRRGKINNGLLQKLNQVEYYKKTNPKSLGKENIVNCFIPLIDGFHISIEDKMRTFYEHIAIQISAVLVGKKTLVTGGGVYNTLLMELIIKKSSSKIIIPSEELISFKEALIFAFLGVLRVRNEINILKSYTGAKENSCSGVVTRVN